jgi:hypothetical protein
LTTVELAKQYEFIFFRVAAVTSIESHGHFSSGSPGQAASVQALDTVKAFWNTRQCNSLHLADTPLLLGFIARIISEGVSWFSSLPISLQTVSCAASRKTV